MKILYLGDTSQSSTSFHRAEALMRLGHSVVLHDPYIVFALLVSNNLERLFHYHTGYKHIQSKLTRWADCITDKVGKVDLVWVNSGELLGYNAIKKLKRLDVPVVLYNNDDVTGVRDGNRFNSLKNSIPLYDLSVVVRDQNFMEYKKLGARKALRVLMSYDELYHQPLSSEVDDCLFKSEVAFIGTWMRHEERDNFLMALIQEGISLSIWGDGWQKSKYYKSLKPFIKGKSIYGRDYVAAIKGSKICIGMLSKGNRDLHTTRSLEIPYAGGLLCAERTTEHLEMYQEGVEAVFWKDAAECAAVCKKMLADDELRERIRKAGSDRVRSLGVGNEDVCTKIIQAIYSEVDQKPFNLMTV